MGRTLIDGWMRLAKWPVDRATGLLPGADHGPRAKATQLVDRTDAALREAVGTVLRDGELRADARRRRIAADERGRAAELRAKADAKRTAAEVREQEQREAAEERREQAQREAQAEATAVKQRRNQRQAQVEKSADAQEQAVAASARKAKDAAASKAKRQRLEVLEDRAEALDTESDALVASDEAERLREAAATTKAARKQRAG
jgi:colicin import membrane protein